jgi:hypothetical protein
MSATITKVLQAAAEIVGGNRELARNLGISEGLLAKFMADKHAVPDSLLLHAVDIILLDRQSHAAPADQTAVQPSREAINGGR